MTEIKKTAGLQSHRCACFSGDAEGSRVQQNAALAASELREARLHDRLQAGVWTRRVVKKALQGLLWIACALARAEN